MTTADKEKRLDQIEKKLTPKEWAIKQADEMRKFRTLPDYTDALNNEDFEKPIKALERQAAELYPGKKPEDIHALNALNKKLWIDFVTLAKLLTVVNLTIHEETEKIGLKAALKLSALHTLILQDAFGRTARKAALWVEEYKTADKDEEENRQLMLKELAAYADVNFGEKFTDSLPLGPDLRIRFPTEIEEWVQGTRTLIADVFAHQTAVKIIQDKHFDGHPILFLDAEASLDNSIKTIQDAAGTFNDYLKTRSELFKSEWDDEEKEDGIASAIPGEREGKLNINIDAIKLNAKGQGAGLAEAWTKRARVETLAQAASPEEAKIIAWNYCRELSGEEK
jgi:hypothetical protein